MGGAVGDVDYGLLDDNHRQNTTKYHTHRQENATVSMSVHDISGNDSRQQAVPCLRCLFFTLIYILHVLFTHGMSHAETHATG